MVWKRQVWGLKAGDLSALDRRYDAIKAFETALSAYGKALEFNPNDPKVWHEKGVILRQLDRKNDALKAFDKSIELNPKKTDSWYEKGLTLKELGRDEESINCFKKVLELEPSHTMARHKLK